MKERNVRIVIVLVILAIHWIIATGGRAWVYQHVESVPVRTLFGCLPSFYSVIGLTSLFLIFDPKRRRSMPFLVGLASLIYEITGDFGRTSGSGTQFDPYDITAILLGVLIGYLLERYYFNRRFSTSSSV